MVFFITNPNDISYRYYVCKAIHNDKKKKTSGMGVEIKAMYPKVISMIIYPALVFLKAPLDP